MPVIRLPVKADPVANTFCPLSNKDFQYLVSLEYAELNIDPNFNYGNATPPPDKRGLPWYRLNGDGSPDKWYSFNQGLWLSPHTLPPGFVGIFTGAQADIPAFDGGNTNAISATDGAFWQKLPGADAKFLVQAGTMDAPDSRVVAVGGTGGVPSVLLQDAQISHDHFIATNEAKNPGNALSLSTTNSIPKSSNYDGAGSPDSFILVGSTLQPSLGLTSPVGDPTTRVTHENLPPYLAVTFIIRTSRLYFSQPA